MLQRGTSIFLAVLLCVAALPLGNIAVTEAQSMPQDRQLIVVQRPADDDFNPYTDEFSGTYWMGGQYISTDAYSVETDTYYAPTPDGTWEEQVDFFYSDSEMTKSDGTTLTYAAYELDRPTNYNPLHITLGGVTLTYNLYTQEVR